MVYDFRLWAGFGKKKKKNFPVTDLSHGTAGHPQLMCHQNGNLSVFLSLGHFELLGNTACFLPSTQEVLCENNEYPALYSSLKFTIVCHSVYLSAWHHQSERSHGFLFVDAVEGGGRGAVRGKGEGKVKGEGEIDREREREMIIWLDKKLRG